LGLPGFSDAMSIPEESIEVIQLDEFWHFINGKKPLWIGE
jgi:hypothetical protein